MTLKNKTISGICLVFVFFVTISLLLYKGTEQSRKKAIILSRMESYADMVSQMASPDSLAAFLPKDIRVTVLDGSGNVTFDSFDPNLGNHADRPEIRNAIESGEGISMRESETSSLPYIYFARRTGDGRIVRIAQIYEIDLQHFLRTDWPLLTSILAIALAALLGIYILIDRAQRREREREEEERRRLKHEMTGNISHELKTPVSSIQGYLEILVNHPECPEERRQLYTERAFAQSLRLSDLIRDIALVTKMEEAPQLFPKERLFLRAAIDQVVEEMTPLLDERGMLCRNEIPESCEVFASSQLIYAIFRNLLENSIKYAGDDTTITIERTSGQGIIYRDNGRGVPESELPHIFDRFWRSDSVRGDAGTSVPSGSAAVGAGSHGLNPASDGSGLGLSIVRNAVHLHGATIRAYIPEPHGLGFVINGL